MRPVYLDHNATTPLAPEVAEAMRPYFGGQFGNPMTAHRWGEGPRAAVDAALPGMYAWFRDDSLHVTLRGLVDPP